MKLTPMMSQYMKIKKEYEDCILFFRLGDFYEMFFEDAKTASRELEITLTGKNIPTPDSGTPSAVGYAEASGIPFGLGLVKNAYVGRTFIQPSQTIRQLGIRLKLNPLKEIGRAHV